MDVIFVIFNKEYLCYLVFGLIGKVFFWVGQKRLIYEGRELCVKRPLWKLPVVEKKMSNFRSCCLKFEVRKKNFRNNHFSMFFRNIFGLNPPKPRMQSSQRFRFSSGFPILKMECQPGGDWNPAWGVVPRNITRTISSQCCVGDSSSWLIYGGFLKWWYPKMDGL